MKTREEFIYYPLQSSVENSTLEAAIDKARGSTFFAVDPRRKIGIYKLVAVVECEMNFRVRKVDEL